jgi:hypothetical protein
MARGIAMMGWTHFEYQFFGNKDALWLICGDMIDPEKIKVPMALRQVVQSEQKKDCNGIENKVGIVAPGKLYGQDC